MRNGSAAVLEADQAGTYNPERDFTATYLNTRTGRKSGRLVSIDEIQHMAAGRLSQMDNGTAVIIRGSIDVVRVFPHSKPFRSPSAMFRLESNTGAATYVRVTYQQYERIWGYLVYGRVVSVFGTVVRPEPGAPEHIDLTRLLLSDSDDVTRERYLKSIAPAVTA